MKKKIIFAISILVVILSISFVSAGLFDFGSDDAAGEVNATVISSEINYEGVSEDNGLTIESNGDNFTLNSGEPEVTIHYSGEVKIDLSNLTEDQIKDIETKFNDSGMDMMIVKYDNTSMSIDYFTEEISDGVLTVFIDFNTTSSSSSIQVGETGTINLESGYIDFYKEDGSEVGFTLNFK